MKNIILMCCLILTFDVNADINSRIANGGSNSSIMDSYNKGVQARQQREMHEQKLQMMRLEEERRRQELIRQQQAQNQTNNSSNGSFKEGFSEGYKTAKEDFYKKDARRIENGILQYMAKTILTESSINELKKSQISSKEAIKKYPDAYWNKAFIILTNHRIKELNKK